jgi:hypothetical protein
MNVAMSIFKTMCDFELKSRSEFNEFLVQGMKKGG